MDLAACVFYVSLFNEGIKTWWSLRLNYALMFNVMFNVLCGIPDSTHNLTGLLSRGVRKASLITADDIKLLSRLPSAPKRVLISYFRIRQIKDTNPSGVFQKDGGRSMQNIIKHVLTSIQRKSFKSSLRVIGRQASRNVHRITPLPSGEHPSFEHGL